MLPKHIDIESLRIAFNLKLKELESVFKTQSDLQEKKDAALEKEIESLKGEINEKEKALRKRESEKKKILEDLKEFEEKNSKLREKLDERDEKILTLNEDFIEKSRDAKIAVEQMRTSEKRLENMKIELSGYLKKLNDSKKKLFDSEAQVTHYLAMYNRVNKMFLKVTEEIDFLKEEFEARNSIQEEFIQNLLRTLKKHGITEFEIETDESESAENEEKCEGDKKENEECLEEVEEEEEEKPPLKIYPWWRPSKSLTTIMEEDESCEADDEGDPPKPIDSAIESDVPSPANKLTEAIVEPLKFPQPPPLPPPPQLAPTFYSMTVQKPAEIVITIESDNEEIETPKKALKVDIAIQIDLDAEEGAYVPNQVVPISNIRANNSMISTPSDSDIVNATDDGKILKKKSKTRSRKKKNSEVKPIANPEEKMKVKRRYSKVLTIGCY